MLLNLTRKWDLGERIGGGGFGQVYAADCLESDMDSAVAKLIPKVSGAQRELLFVKLDGVRNVVPIIDSGETTDHWVLIMPRAEKSLRQHIIEEGPILDILSAIRILADIATALVDLNGKVVHRDLKPENVLFLKGSWCLADFGISRYAEATTAPDTQKYSLSPPYAAPEQWRTERATGATDIYALGIIGYELLSGSWPFKGPDMADFRDQHLHVDAPSLNIGAALASVVGECLYKSAGARPAPENLLTRLEAVSRTSISAGRARLQQANMQEVVRQSEGARQESSNRSEMERRRDLFRDASMSFQKISKELRTAIADDAPAAIIHGEHNGGWTSQIGPARLVLTEVTASPTRPWDGWEAPAFDVIAYASIGVHLPADRFGFQGRAHSIWFCDAKEAGRYGWFETAFMITPFISRSSSLVPFAMDLGEGAAKALWNGMAEYQVAWPFTPLILGDLSEFIDRWLGWFADASQGQLRRPPAMPERPAEGSWRR